MENVAKVSVIIPNYNHARYLPQRIESVLNQNYRNLEVIILDDCSSDNSREVISEYAAKDDRIRLAFNEQNSGSTFKQWNKGIGLATGKYVWLAESDDFADEQLLEILVGKLEANPTVGLAYANSQIVDEDSQHMENWAWLYDGFETNLWDHDFIMPGREIVTKYMIYRTIIPNASAVVIKRDILQKVGPADEIFRVNGDWIFWAKILAVTDVAFVHRRLNFFRHHYKNVRTRTIYDGTALSERVRVAGYIQTLVTPDAYFLDKMLNALIDEWLISILDINYKIPLALHRKIYQGLHKLEANFGRRLRRKVAHRLTANRMSGLRQLLGDGLMYRVLGRKQR